MKTLPATPDRKRLIAPADAGSAAGFRQLLVPVDFSPASLRGVAFAGAIAARFGARIQLLHDIEPPTLPVWGYAHIPRRQARLREAARKRFQELPAECGVDPGLIGAAGVRCGDAVDEIRAAAAEGGADLIVLASHGLGIVPSSLIGSTAEQVVRTVPCAVLTVREQALRARGTPRRAADLRRILVVTDFSPESLRAVPRAAELAREFDATLLLLHVIPPTPTVSLVRPVARGGNRGLAKEARRRLAGVRASEIEADRPVEVLLREGRPASVIGAVAGEKGADLIVMMTHGRTGLRHFVPGSVTEHVVRHAPCPVLVVR